MYNFLSKSQNQQTSISSFYEKYFPTDQSRQEGVPTDFHQKHPKR